MYYKVNPSRMRGKFNAALKNDTVIDKSNNAAYTI